MAPLANLRPIARRSLAAQSDERLVKLLREGHDSAFEEMVKRYRGPLVAFAAAIVSASGAEDVVQAALAKAHGALLADDREINLRPWLFTIVRNTALNEVRREPRVDELSEAMATSAGPSEIAEQNDEFDRLILAMCALPDAQRQALVMRELEGVGHGEIAAQLGTTATAVRGLIFRARSGLRDAVGALIPLPILRSLLSDATATGIAGGAAGGAGAGAAAIIGGGGAAKGATAIAAAVVALGTGLAIDQGRSDRSTSGRSDSSQVTRATPSSAADAATTASTATPTPTADVPDDNPTASVGNAQSSGSGEGESFGSGTSGSTGESSSGSSSSGESSAGSAPTAPDSSGPGPSGSGGGGSGSGDGPGPSSPPPPPGGEPIDGDHSGPGGGHSGSGEQIQPPPPPPPDDFGTSGSGGHSGPGGGSQYPPPPEEIEDDSFDDGVRSPDGGGHGGHSGPG